MILLFACARLCRFVGAPVWTNSRKMRNRLHAEPAGNTVKLKCLADGAPPLTTLWFKNNHLIERDQRIGGYRVLVCNNHRIFLSDILNLIGTYKISMVF